MDVPAEYVADCLRVKSKADDRYYAYRRRWQDNLYKWKEYVSSYYGKAPKSFHEQVKSMKAEEKLEFLPAYMEYLIDIKQGNRVATASKHFVRIDIREELPFEHWLAVHLYDPMNVMPTPNWDKGWKEPEPTKVEVDPSSGSITIWSW